MKKVFLATSAFFSSVMFANSVSATTTTFSSTITVLDDLAISQTTQLNLGKILTPGSDVVVHVAQAGGNGANTTATMIDTSSMSPVVLKITGSSVNTISISGANGGGVAGFTFNTMYCKYNNGSSTDILAAAKTAQSAPTSSGKNLQCGANVTVAGSVTDGTYAPDYDVTIAYE